ncbi:hypothetical protein O181_031485 [Austropuccinia psidii MF-1]|uniref:Uncharacterized protein n=1 Tax=Austropuccinia psidii MF-1 TaxID=1389203 RepID=A0A9Q3H791_9BASI|nr:hypothetical protein [Austropuccinia psidii MF-1]
MLGRHLAALRMHPKDLAPDFYHLSCGVDALNRASNMGPLAISLDRQIILKSLGGKVLIKVASFVFVQFFWL